VFSSRKRISQRKKIAGKDRGAVPKIAAPRIPLTARDRMAGRWFARLVALQARLRDPGGCPWDRQQTHESLRKFLVEETYEVLEAMESGNSHKFASELGDLLLQIVFHSILAEETGRFTMSDVIESVHTKMVRRHPHVFGAEQAKTASEVLRNWEQLKATERAEENASGGPASEEDAPSQSILAGVSPSMPSVLEAYQLTRRASHVGFDWDDVAGVLDKLDEEKRELNLIASDKMARAGVKSRPTRISSRSRSMDSRPDTSGMQRLEEEAGDLLFAAVNVARFLGVDPEIALRKANRKFKKRFEWMESVAAREGRRFADLPRTRMEELWNKSKVNG
jgi:tetrapyrrole methylase family protein / MazG family protein